MPIQTVCFSKRGMPQKIRRKYNEERKENPGVPAGTVAFDRLYCQYLRRSNMNFFNTHGEISDWSYFKGS